MKKKSLAVNSIFNMAYKGFTALFPLVTTTYISRILLADGVGKVAYANTIAAWFVMLASLGLPSYGVKAIAQNNRTKEERSRTFLELFFINLCATLLCTISYYLFVSMLPHFAGRRTLFWISGLSLFLNIFNIDWFYQGLEEYRYIATRSFLVKILSFAAMLAFVKKQEDYLIYAFILCIATAGNNLPNAWNLKKYITLSVPGGLSLRQHIRSVLILLASTIATEIYTMLDTVMLEYFHSDTFVGYYSNAVKIVRMTYTVVIALVAVFYPRISMYFKQNNDAAANQLISRGTKILLLLAAPASVGLLLTAEYIVPLLLGGSFLPSVGTLRILSVLVLIFSVSYFLGHVILTAAGKERLILYAALTGALINAAANILLIPSLKQDGAAIASVLSETGVMLVLLYHSRKYYRLDIGRRYTGSLLFALVLLVLCVSAAKRLCSSSPVSAIPIIAASAVCYFAALLVTKNDTITGFIVKIKDSLRKRH